MAELSWRDIISADVEALPMVEQIQSTSKSVSVPLFLPLWQLTQKAAAARGISVRTYMRRALIAMLATEADTPSYHEIIQLDPRVQRGNANVEDPSGVAVGPFEIEKLVEVTGD